MKRAVILTIAGAVMTATAHAGTMCSNNDYLTVVLDPAIEPTSYTYDAGAMTWRVTAPYGNLSGIAVCNDTSGSYAAPSTTEQVETGGVMCWCKMTHPAVSLWVFRYADSSSSDCAAGCAGSCGNSVRNGSGFRSGVFSSVGK